MTYEQALIAAVGGLCGVVIVLWRWFLHAYKQMEVRANECLTREYKLLERIIKLELLTNGHYTPPPTKE